MEIIKVEKKHLDQVTEIAYDMYQSECNYVIIDSAPSKCITEAINKM